MQKQAYLPFLKDHLGELCRTPSPTGMTHLAERLLMATLTQLGFSPWQSHKGAVFCRLNEGAGAGILLAAHIAPSIFPLFILIAHADHHLCLAQHAICGVHGMHCLGRQAIPPPATAAQHEGVVCQVSATPNVVLVSRLRSVVNALTGAAHVDIRLPCTFANQRIRQRIGFLRLKDTGEHLHNGCAGNIRDNDLSVHLHGGTPGVIAVTAAALVLLYGFIESLLVHRFAERLRASERLGRLLRKLTSLFLIGFGVRLATSS